ncbi:hypothetical protein CDL15_Pgr027180 [Punica granatum]|uniref:Uncharacterized protein n=1 Tax=Punica granatum TaxID=22663 RepID=A0A218XC95_PUNGR|nr:hypothetical protein CDL15_Pgr027180 [Punica granatum]
MSTFHDGLRNEDLIKALLTTPPEDFTEMNTVAQKYVRFEESLPCPKRGRRNKRRSRGIPLRKIQSETRTQAPLEGIENQFSPLNATRAVVINKMVYCTV